jgi:hypothetical protein
MRRLALVAVLLVGAPAFAEKDRQTAQILSGAGAGLSTALVLASFAAPGDDIANRPLLYTGIATSLVTPSLGEWYAGQYLTWGMGIRAAAAGLGVYAVATQNETITCDIASPTKCKRLTGDGIALLGIAAIAYIGGAWWDIADAPDAVDNWNSAHGILVPTVLPTPSGGVAPGLYFSLTF